MPQTSKAKTTSKRKTASAKSSAKYLVIVESPAKAKTIKKYFQQHYCIIKPWVLKTSISECLKTYSIRFWIDLIIRKILGIT